MKVLFSTTSFDTIDNGPALFANLLYNHFINRNDSQMVVLTENLTSEKGERPQLIKLNLEQTKYNSFFYQFIRIYKYHKAAEKLDKEFNFDMIVYNNAFTGYLSALYLKKPVVVMVNDYELVNKPAKFNLSKHYFKSTILRYLERKGSLKAKTVITNSQFMKKLLSDAYGIEKKKLKVLTKGIDLTKYNYRFRQDFKDQINILFVKADYKRGRLDNVVQAISQIKDYNLKLIVIGPPKHELENVKAILNNGGIEYELHGAMRPEEVRTYFDSSDIFCLPPIKEALGVANMEALASGIPVIATNVGGIPEVLDYGKCGWLIEADNIEELKLALIECIEDKALRLEKTEHGYQFVQQFNSNNLMKNFTKILEDAMK